MSILDKYLMRHVLVATLFTTAVVTAVIWLTQALRLLELVLDRGAPITVLLWMLLLTVPTFLSLVLPLGLTLATMFVLYKLALDSELVVMRAAGQSDANVARPLLRLAALVVLVGYVVTFFISPAANRELSRQEFLVKNDYALVLLRDGMFNTLGDNITVYVRERLNEKELRGILLHDASKPDKITTLIAERGVLVAGAVDTGGSAKIVLLNGIQQEQEQPSGRLSELSFRQYAIDLGQFGRDYQERWQQPRERSLWGLLQEERFADEPLVMGRLRAELHSRIAAPLLALGFTAFAAAVLLTARIGRQGAQTRMIIAASVLVLWQVAFLSAVSNIPRIPELVYACYALVFLPLPYLWLVLCRQRWGLWRSSKTASMGAA